MITESSFRGKHVTYLGDGLYASFDGFTIWLESSNGIEILDRVALEPEVFDALIRYARATGRKIDAD